MTTLVAAWASYLTAITLIYTIGQKAAEFLSKEALERLSAFGAHHPISRTLAITVDTTMSIIDWALAFRAELRFFKTKFLLNVPDIKRSALFSLFLVALISFPLRSFMFVYIPPFYFGISEIFRFGSSPDPVMSLLPVCALIAFVGTNATTDYFSFIKTRTLLDRFYNIRSPFRELLILPADLIMSILLCLIVSIVISEYMGSLMVLNVKFGLGLSVITLFAPVVVISTLLRVWKLSIPLIVLIDLGAMLILSTSIFRLLYDEELSLAIFISVVAFIPGTFMFSLVTSLGIAIILLFVGVVEIVRQLTWKIESTGVWSLLNFRGNPSQSAAVIVILVFTVLYWAWVVFVVLR